MQHTLQSKIHHIFIGGDDQVQIQPHALTTPFNNMPTDEAGEDSISPLSEGKEVGSGLPEYKDVLVVEDEAYLCDLVADVLDAEGHTTRTASNGVEGLKLVADRKPQIILLDLMMPVMDGWEFIRALRANPAWQDIPIVVVTAVYDIRRTQQETGAVAVVTKPFDIDQIAAVVQRYGTPTSRDD